MWPEQQQTPDAESNLFNPLRQESAADEDEDVRIQSELPTFGSALKAPGIPIEDYADFSELLTKPETIAESLGPKTGNQSLKDFLMLNP